MISFDEYVCCTKIKIFIGKNCANTLKDEVKGKALIIRQKSIPVNKIINMFTSSDNVYEIILDGGEQDKDLEVVLKIVDLLYINEFQRKDYIIAVGGGTLTDVAGFIASIYMRGLNFIAIPTTLLGMVDAAIGGKNAVNFRYVKNVLGTFYQPTTIIIDLDFLDTLPQQELVNGIAEVIKYGVTLDRDLFMYLKNNATHILGRDTVALEHIIHRSVIDKLIIVKEDPYELKDIRIVLNFGHTIGHAIESASKLKISHGKAIAIGMILEALLGIEIGITPKHCLDQLIDVIKLYGLPTSLDELDITIDKDIFISTLSRDKKSRRDTIVMPLLTDIGSWSRHYISIGLVKEVISKWIG